MLNQGLAIGLEGPVREDDFAAMEEVLGTPTVLEISAGADPSVYPMLTHRGYRIQAFQQVWMRVLDQVPASTPGGFVVRPIEASEAECFASLVVAGFCEQDELSHEGIHLFLPATQAQGTTCFMARLNGEPVGAGTVSIQEGVAVLSGTSVRPRFRGRGCQGALIQARLAFAQANRCAQACSATVPHGPSQFNLQRHGFQVAYPKLEMAR